MAMHSIRFASCRIVLSVNASLVSLLLMPALAWSVSSPKGAPRQEWEARFKQTDTNKSGGLSQKELKKTDKPRFALIKQHFKAMDSNRNGEVSIAERDTFIAKTSPTAPSNKQ